MKNALFEYVPPASTTSGRESAGLRGSLWYTEGFATRSGIAVQLNVPASIPRFLNEIETALFLILQQSLTNGLRHSHRKRVDIDIFHDRQCRWWFAITAAARFSNKS